MAVCNDMVIKRYDGGYSACVFTRDANSITSIDLNQLNWHDVNEYSDGWLTLQEIGNQVKALYGGNMPALYVWYEGPFRGTIYQTGNYSDSDDWVLHGETQGYA